MKDPLKIKSYDFALMIVNLYKELSNDKREYVLSKQILKSGTAIGALVSEAEFAQSKADFINKLSVALKEANETRYWLNLLNDTNYLSNNHFEKIYPNIKEIIKLLVVSIKTAKANNRKGIVNN